MIKIMKADIVDDLNIGETLMFFKLQLEHVTIKNCSLMYSKKNQNYYWCFPQQLYIDKTGTKIYTDIIAMNSKIFKIKVLNIAIHKYEEVKSRRTISLKNPCGQIS